MSEKKLTRNVFNIPNAEECVCKIVNYISGHSQLYIKVYNPVEESDIRIGFEGVLYIECPAHWGSAAFYKGSDEECLRIVQKVGGFEGIPEAYLLERLGLYMIDSRRNEGEIIVKILALPVYVS